MKRFNLKKGCLALLMVAGFVFGANAQHSDAQDSGNEDIKFHVAGCGVQDASY